MYCWHGRDQEGSLLRRLDKLLSLASMKNQWLLDNATWLLRGWVIILLIRASRPSFQILNAIFFLKFWVLSLHLLPLKTMVVKMAWCLAFGSSTCFLHLYDICIFFVSLVLFVIPISGCGFYFLLGTIWCHCCFFFLWFFSMFWFEYSVPIWCFCEWEYWENQIWSSWSSLVFLTAIFILWFCYFHVLIISWFLLPSEDYVKATTPSTDQYI